VSLNAPQYSRYVRDFSAGFLDSPESDTLPLGACIDGRNCFLSSVMETRDGPDGARRAVVRKRKLAQLINPTAMAAGKTVDLLFWYQPEGGDAELLAVCNGALYVFDGVDTFTSVGALTGFTAGALVQAVPFKDNVLLTDGNAMLRYNGTSLLAVGFIAPTAAPGLAIVAGGSLPVGATYESYAVWYDSVMDHESSPSATAAAVTTTAGNLQRRHTKPAGSPPANVDKWRVYVRRTDTNELNFFLTATVAVGTATHDEMVSDAARRTAGPKDSVNNPPPTFATVAVYKDYGIGIEPDDSYYSVSKHGDLESWNPNDKFALERGAGKPLRSATVFGSDILLQKPTKTWRLVGDRPPFKAEPVHTEFGNVGPRSAIEVERLLYAWDEQKGPYRTDLVDWEPLATNRIATFLLNLNRDELANIQVDHDPENNLIVWAIAASSRTQARRRHLLAFNYRLNTWVPPICGLEYATLARYQPPSGKLGLYCGDYWGRVYKLFEQDREGVPGGATIIGTVTSATASTVTCSGATFYTTGSGLAGLMVLAESPTGAFQWRRIQSNTATVITLDTTNDNPWTTTPVAGWTIHLGAVEAYWTTPWVDLGRPELLKKGGFLFVEGKSAVSGDVLTVKARFNQQLGAVYTYDFAFPTQGAVWGVDLWGEASWGLRRRLVTKRRINRAFYSMQVRFESYLADTPVDITAFGIEADGRRRKRAA